MSGISGISNDYQSQVNQLGTDVADIEAAVKKLELENQNVVDAYKKAKDTVAATLAWVRTFGLTDMQGKPLQFNTLQEFHDLCCKGGIEGKDGLPVNSGNGFQYSVPPVAEQLNALKAAETAYNRVMGPTLERLQDAQKRLDVLGGGLKESIAALQAMKKLLDSGDIEGAVMLLQTSRSKVLEQQLATRIEGMQVRNAQIKGLNDALKLEQQKLGAVTGTDAQKQQARDNINATITGIKGDLDKLNSDSQLDMIGIQGLVNKRNEAFDMLSNLLNKFQKTIDGIVGNMR
jgi:hypothetical protein